MIKNEKLLGCNEIISTRLTLSLQMRWNILVAFSKYYNNKTKQINKQKHMTMAPEKREGRAMRPGITRISA